MRQTILAVLATIIVSSIVACRESELPTHPAAATNPATPDAAAEARSSPIVRIEPGTRVDLKSLPAQTHLVLRSTPKVTGGEVGKVRKSIVEALHTFSTILLLQSEPDPADSGRFRRGPLTIGISIPGEQGDIVLTKASADRLGIGLSFFESRVLTEREKELATVVSPGATSTMALVDFPTFLRRGGDRSRTVIRYASLVDGAAGRVDTLCWLLETEADALRFSDGSLRRLPPQCELDWEMHVDGASMTLGVPAAEAFSAVKMPDGAALDASEELKTDAAARAYSADGAGRLERLLRDLLTRRPSRSDD
mgnify:CR=1 FL=1